MITVSSALTEIIKKTPLLEDFLNRGLVNFSALARYYRKEVERKALKPVKSGAILMALKRMSKQKNQEKMTFQNVGKPLEVVTRSNLFEITIKNNQDFSFFNNIYALKKDGNYFLTLSEGVFETTIIASLELKKEILKNINNLIKVSEIDNLSSITLRLPKDNISTPGVYYQILKKFYWEGVNIIEVVSTTNEITIIIHQKDIEKVFGLLGE
jgi:hypothetical protein